MKLPGRNKNRSSGPDLSHAFGGESQTGAEIYGSSYVQPPKEPPAAVEKAENVLHNLKRMASQRLGSRPSAKTQEQAAYTDPNYAQDPGSTQNYASDPYGYTQDPYASQGYAQDPYGAQGYSQDPYAAQNYAQSYSQPDMSAQAPSTAPDTWNNPFTDPDYDKHPYAHGYVSPQEQYEREQARAWEAQQQQAAWEAQQQAWYSQQQAFWEAQQAELARQQAVLDQQRAEFARQQQAWAAQQSSPASSEASEGPSISSDEYVNAASPDGSVPQSPENTPYPGEYSSGYSSDPQGYYGNYDPQGAYASPYGAAPSYAAANPTPAPVPRAKAKSASSALSDLRYGIWGLSIVIGMVLTLFTFIYACAV